MTEYAPDAIKAAFTTINAAIPSAQLSGIIGDRAHTYGYHRGRDFIGSDYSTQHANDRVGPGQAASALDVSLPADQMSIVTRRLIAATDAKDPRLQALREFYGTTNGSTVTGRDLPTGNWVSSDDSHLWHVHLSGHRRWADDHAAWQQIASVFTGGTAAASTPEGDDVPKQLVLSASSKKPTTIPKGKWVTVGFDSWSPKDASGGASAVLPSGASIFSLTADLKLEGLSADHNLYIRVQTLDRNGKQQALYPIAEIRATTGADWLTYSRVGSAPNNTNLRLLVSATGDTVITEAQWRVLFW